MFFDVIAASSLPWLLWPNSPVIVWASEKAHSWRERTKALVEVRSAFLLCADVTFLLNNFYCHTQHTHIHISLIFTFITVQSKAKRYENCIPFAMLPFRERLWTSRELTWLWANRELHSLVPKIKDPSRRLRLSDSLRKSQKVGGALPGFLGMCHPRTQC